MKILKILSMRTNNHKVGKGCLTSSMRVSWKALPITLMRDDPMWKIGFRVEGLG
jgi:hypothetical protein